MAPNSTASRLAESLVTYLIVAPVLTAIIVYHHLRGSELPHEIAALLDSPTHD